MHRHVHSKMLRYIHAYVIMSFAKHRELVDHMLNSIVSATVAQSMKAVSSMKLHSKCTQEPEPVELLAGTKIMSHLSI